MDLKIIKIAGIVFAIVFIGLLAVIMGIIMNKGNSASTKMTDTLSMTDTFDLNNYDGATIIGEAVRTAISNGKTIGGTNKLVLLVRTIDNGAVWDVYGYGKTGTTTSGDIKDVTGMKKKGAITWAADASTYNSSLNNTPTDKDYINPTASFRSALVTNKNNVVVGIYFEQDGVTT